MANDGTIQSKLQLDGEKQYKQALNDAYRSLRVLRSELKAETAELGRNASEQDKARAKMKSLQQQIQQQEKIVKTLEKALADSKKEYADNQEVQDKWAEKLNKARAALADMQNQLGSCDDSLSKFSSEMKDVADSSGQAMQTVVSFNDCMKSIGSIVGGVAGDMQGIFNATLDTVKDIVSEMMGLMGMAWATAGEWKDIQSVWGGSLESIERVYTAMELQGVDPSKVTSSMQKLVANVHSGSKDAEKALNELGLTESQFTSHWDMFVTVMDRLSSEYYTKGDRYNLASMIFGEKKGSDVMLLLDNWDDAMNRYQKDVKDTDLELSSPEIEELDKVSHKITEIQALWNTVKTNVGAKLSKILNIDEASNDVLDILRTVGAILNSEGETRAELVIKLSDQIENLIGDIKTGMENLSGFLEKLGGDLEKSEDPFVQLIGKVLNEISKVLDWLTKDENWKMITDFIQQALPWVLKNKMVEATTGKGIGDWVTDIFQTGLEIVAITRLGKAFGASAGTAIGSTAGTFGSAIGAALLKAVPFLAFGYTLLNPSATSDELGNNTLIDENGKLTPEAEAYGFTYNENGELVQDVDKANPDLLDPAYRQYLQDKKEEQQQQETLAQMTPEQWEAAQKFWDVMRENPYDFSDEDWDAFENAFAGQEELFDAINSKMDEIVQGVDDESWRELEDLPADWFQSISGALKNLSQDNYRGAMDEDMPGKISSAVASAVKGIPITVNVYVDGEEVGATTNRYLGGQLSNLFG